VNHSSLSASSPSSSTSPAPLTHELRLVEEERSLRILLAEDNHELRRLLSFVLRREGHEVVEAHDGSELLEALAVSIVEGTGQGFDVVICEQSLPGIPGLSVLAGLRARDRVLPFILITSNPEVQGQARRLDAVVLDRPLTVGAIRQAVRQTEQSLRALPGPFALALP
jgi:two-component system cell cycle sensor histidine kinase/response regulator CckA